MKPQEFIETLFPAAQTLQRNTGLFSSLTIAQAILETGWGEYIPADRDTGHSSNNLFGIKGQGPAGSVVCWTEEENPDGSRIRTLAKFRAYNSFGECLQDRYEVLMQPRYDRVREASTPEAAAGMLYICGYATDSEYTQKLIQLMHDWDLKQYDKLPVIPNDPFQGIPEWAMAPVKWAAAKGLIKDPAGSEDFYRFITVLWNYNKMKG